MIDLIQDLINTLRTEILSLKSKNSDIHHELRMEQQYNKHATSKYSSIASQILLLKKADAISSAQLSKGLRDSAATITKFLKINEHLQTELSQSVTTWSSQKEALTEAAQSKLLASDTRLKKAQKEVSKLRKAFGRATQIKEHAVETAKAKVIQKKSVYHLSHKGVFTQKTRNLVTGMNMDHCAKEKKDAYEMEELKKWAVNQHLGEEAILEKSLQEIYRLQMDAQKKK